MIHKHKAQKIISNSIILSARNSGKKINEWVSNIMHQAVAEIAAEQKATASMETPSSMEGPPSMDTPPWKGTHGDV